MNIHNRILRKNEKGATAVYAAVVLAVLLMFAALGVDVNYLYGVRNELHNAADAGSLAGASKLFNSDGDLTRDAAIAEATKITSANKTGNEDVVAGTVETGHWSFGSKTFTASENTTQLEGWQEMSFSELDGNPAFINAVRVQADRSDTPSFFARIFSLLGSNFNQLFVSADAVAYIGFPGTFQVDQPIAICKESIFDPDDESYSCNMGRMINSGGNPATHNTAGWTNFTQPCETAAVPTVAPYICGQGSPELHSGQGMGTTGGTQQSTLSAMYDCWVRPEHSDNKTKNWLMTLPVVECPDNNISNCAKLVGAVDVNLIWIIEKEDPSYDDVPTKMRITDDDGVLIPDGPWVDNPWTCSGAGFTCWKDFVDNFKLANVDGPPSADNEFQDYKDMYQKKNMFFLPDCEYHEPIGGSGGENFGIMARIPKLVE